MLKTYLYIPDELNKEIVQLASTQKKSKAAVLRAVITKGIEATKKERASGAEWLLKLAEMAKKYDVKGPKDLSINHDYYLYGGKKKYKT